LVKLPIQQFEMCRLTYFRAASAFLLLIPSAQAAETRRGGDVFVHIFLRGHIPIVSAYQTTQNGEAAPLAIQSMPSALGCEWTETGVPASLP
jgi:hypothetical protein